MLTRHEVSIQDLINLRQSLELDSESRDFSAEFVAELADRWAAINAAIWDSYRLSGEAELPILAPIGRRAEKLYLDLREWLQIQESGGSTRLSLRQSA